MTNTIVERRVSGLTIFARTRTRIKQRTLPADQKTFIWTGNSRLRKQRPSAYVLLRREEVGHHDRSRPHHFGKDSSVAVQVIRVGPRADDHCARVARGRQCDHS